MIELIVEGKSLEPALRAMDRSPAIRVIGPDIWTPNPGSEVISPRVAVEVRAESAAEASTLVRRYLPDDCKVRPALA